MAVETALKEKQNIWAVSTSKVATFRIQKFIEFLKQQHIAGLDSRQLTRIHVTSFLKKLQEKGESQTSVNNYRAALSGIFSQMVENNHIEYNYVKDIKKTKSNPIKNHPFTKKQILDIKTELEENDPYLLLFLRVLAYSFLRNLEVIRLRVKDIDLRNRLITDQTKTRRLEKIFITDNLMEIFRAMELEKYDPEDFVFSLKGTPGKWETSEKGRYDYFSKKFKRIKKKLVLGPEYGIYSFRHSFAINVYEGFEMKGLNHQEILLKMLPITRHKSKAGLENYLREKKQMLPKNYSENISIDF